MKALALLAAIVLFVMPAAADTTAGDTASSGIILFDALSFPAEAWESSCPTYAGGGTVEAEHDENGVLTLRNVGGAWPSAQIVLYPDNLRIAREDWGNIYLYFDVTVADGAESAFFLYHGVVEQETHMPINRTIQPDDNARNAVNNIMPGVWIDTVNFADVMANVTALEQDGSVFTIIDNPFDEEYLDLAGLRIHAVTGDIVIREFHLVFYPDMPAADAPARPGGFAQGGILVVVSAVLILGAFVVTVVKVQKKKS